jgi:hypothetical protein
MTNSLEMALWVEGKLSACHRQCCHSASGEKERLGEEALEVSDTMAVTDSDSGAILGPQAWGRESGRARGRTALAAASRAQVPKQ